MWERVRDVQFVVAVFALAIGLGVLHGYHVASMFENSRHFSHLSPLEREMTLRTEAGMYYSYYKTIVEADTFAIGLRKVMNDGLVEYPDAVNALKRFNIYPEVLIGYLFHIYSHLGFEDRQCWNIRRNGRLSDRTIVSCEGIGEPIYFYLMFIWGLAGLTVMLIFIFSLYLCKNIYGGILAVLFYFYNHSEATRVQWSPPLRENFAFPFIILNAMTVTFFLRRMVLKPLECNILQVWTVGITGCACLILWQFSQFVLMTQLLILFFMEQFGLIVKQHFFLLLSGHLISIYLAVIIMQGNSMLIDSPYLSLTSGVCINFMIWDDILPRFYRAPERRPPGIFHALRNVIIVVALTLALKTKLSMLVGGGGDDSHIADIFKSKLFGSYGSFHATLYTCSAEFDFLLAESVWEITSTLLLPSAFASSLLVFMSWIVIEEKKSKKKSKKNKNDLAKCWQIEPDVLFNILQLLAYFSMAILIMRLKLFSTSYLCIVASLGTARKYYHRYINKDNKKMLSIIFIIIVAAMSLKGIPNLMSQRNIVGEFNNEPLEELLLWINGSTEKTAAFAGPMPLTAAIMLSTRRPIVNHPHYEDANLSRARTKVVYSMFSRQSPNDLYAKLTKLKITYLVIDSLWCFHKSTTGCTMLDIWDAEEPHLRAEPPLCHRLYHDIPVPHFHRVFANSQYVVLKLHEKSLNVKLKNYETYAM